MNLPPPSPLRLGLLGLGNIGHTHAAHLRDGHVPRATLAAVCDPKTERFAAFPDAAAFTEPAALFASGRVDAVVIATPHTSHVPLALEALAAGLHILVEKPLATHLAEAARLVAALPHYPGRIAGLVFNQRTDPRYRRLKELLDSGQLGTLRRFAWTITDWFRTEAYYANGGWRATWAGEGGGVLLNQSIHQLDLLAWFFGLPGRLRAVCHLGRYHDIEVEDDATATLEYPGGLTGVFTTSTGEAPGVNRLEIAADHGLLTIDSAGLTWQRNLVPASAFSRASGEAFAQPPAETLHFPAEGPGTQHLGILQNFAAAILDGEPLLAPAASGLASLELANAMLHSHFLDRALSLPLDAAAYAEALAARIAASPRSHQPRMPSRLSADFAQSFPTSPSR